MLAHSRENAYALHVLRQVLKYHCNFLREEFVFYELENAYGDGAVDSIDSYLYTAYNYKNRKTLQDKYQDQNHEEVCP